METKYTLSNDTWGAEERDAVETVLNEKFFTMGKAVEQAEKEAAKAFGRQYSVMVNSGSSANLLAIAAMVQAGRLQPGDEILVPAVSWGTTYFPIEQLGLRMRLVDIDKETLNMDLAKAEEAITENTRAIFAVNLLGNPNDFSKLEKICRDHDLILMEDNCESMGAKYNGRQAGSFGVFGTYSTFFSHHLCTMEGGFVATDDKELYEYMLSTRAHGWTRNLPEENMIYNKSPNSFYDSFCFVLPGYNLRPLEMEGAIFLEQIKKLNRLVAQRRENAALFMEKIGTDERFMLQKETGESSWFGFSMVLREPDVQLRDRVVSKLVENGIETRPIVAGNFARQPVFGKLHATVSGELVNADYIHDNGFFVGNHSVEMEEEISYLKEVLEKI